MSESTNGLLILKSDAPKAQTELKKLEHPYILKDLNDRWSVIVFEDPDIRHAPVCSWMFIASNKFPMLYLVYREDEGWGYNFFHNSWEAAALGVRYNLDDYLWREIAAILYPNRNPDTNLEPEVSDEIYSLVRESLQNNIKQQYRKAHPDKFTVFGLSPESITRLREIFDMDWEKTEWVARKQYQAFKEILGIEEMNWVSYRYLSKENQAGHPL